MRQIFGDSIFIQKVVSLKNKKEQIIELITTIDFFKTLKDLKVTNTIEPEQNLRLLL